jgi:hypothetical protein
MRGSMSPTFFRTATRLFVVVRQLVGLGPLFLLCDRAVITLQASHCASPRPLWFVDLSWRGRRPLMVYESLK